jgi:hypothetical protein
VIRWFRDLSYDPRPATAQVVEDTKDSYLAYITDTDVVDVMVSWTVDDQERLIWVNGMGLPEDYRVASI